MNFDLKAVAIVMDLGKRYHNLAEKISPRATRIVDYFHVNGYITDALYSIHEFLFYKMVYAEGALNLEILSCGLDNDNKFFFFGLIKELRRV